MVVELAHVGLTPHAAVCQLRKLGCAEEIKDRVTQLSGKLHDRRAVPASE